MSDNPDSNYKISIIVEHDLSLELFEVFTEWLKKQRNTSQISFEKSALINNPSFRFMNPEGISIKIDDIRNFNQELSFSSYDNQLRYFIFFNFDLATLQAQNAALKSIEEPPKNTQIVLLTTTLDKLLPTIISRCKVVSLKKAPTKETQLSETKKAYDTILKSKHYELIELTSKYKGRAEAIVFFDKLLSFLNFQLHEKKSNYNKNQLAEHLKITLKTLEYLNKNVNVKLAIENCFFELISDE